MCLTCWSFNEHPTRWSNITSWRQAVHVAKNISQLETVYGELKEAMMNLAKALCAERNVCQKNLILGVELVKL